MTEDEAFNELEARLERKRRNNESALLSPSNIAAAEFIASRTVDELAITTLRKAFIFGYHTGFRDAKEKK